MRGLLRSDQIRNSKQIHANVTCPENRTSLEGRFEILNKIWLAPPGTNWKKDCSIIMCQ
jgi:hypothetical protein